MKLVITVACKGQWRQAGLSGGYADFLGQLTYKRGLGRFARLDLATRELPKSGQLLALRPLGKEVPGRPASTRAQAATSNIFLSPIVSVSRFLAVGVAIDLGKAGPYVETRRLRCWRFPPATRRSPLPDVAPT